MLETNLESNGIGH